MAKTVTVFVLSFPLLLALGGEGLAQPARPDTVTARFVLERARTSAPPVLIAGTQADAAKARLDHARLWFPRNPELEVLGTKALGPQWEVTIPVEFGYRRGRRTAVAKAELERERHMVRNAQSHTAADALSIFYRAMHARDRWELAQEWNALSQDLHRVTEEKNRAGDAARLDLRLSEAELARSVAEARFAEQALAEERVNLAAALGLSLSSSLVLGGRLTDRSVVEEALRDGIGTEREDLAAARKEVAAARARLSLAKTEILPDLAFRWDRDEEDTGAVDRWGVEMSIPVFVRGQGSKGEARAGIRRAELELAMLQTTTATQVEAARQTYAAAQSALQELEGRGLPAALEGEAMALEGYRAGKIDLPTLLLIRRQLLETRREASDVALQTALAGIELARALGAWQ